MSLVVRGTVDFFKHLDHSLSSVLPSGSWKIFWVERTKTVSLEELLLHAWVYLWQQIGRLSGEQLDYSGALFPQVSCFSDEPQLRKLFLLCLQSKKPPKPTGRQGFLTSFLLLSSACLPGMLGNTNTLLRTGMICIWSEGVDVVRGWFLIK